MKDISDFIKKHWFVIALLLITVIAALLRFYHYADRWGLAYDQAHDVIIARYAVAHGKLPLLGPFSSAGAFQTGGEWYWFIMLGAILFPFFINGPWIFLTLTQVFFVFCIGLVGKQLIDKKFALIAAGLAAISVGNINQSVNLTNQSILACIALGTIYFSFKYVQILKPKFLFMLGLSIGLAASIHLQGIALLSVALFTLIFTKCKKLYYLPFLILGGIIPWIPIFIADSQNHFYNTRNMIQYYLHDQYKIPLEVFGRRWLTYAGIFWPTSWANIAGGQVMLGYMLLVGSFLTIIWAFLRKKINTFWGVLFCSFAMMIIMLRYVRTPLFDSYLMFLHPFVFFFSAFFLYQILKKQIFIGFLVFGAILFFSMNINIKNIRNAVNDTSNRAIFWSNLLSTTYPNKKFFMYDYTYKNVGFSLPLIVYMQYQNKLSDNGYKISFGRPEYKDDPAEYKSFPEIKNNFMGFDLVDVDASSSAQLQKVQFNPINPSYIYHSTQEWFRN